LNAHEFLSIDAAKRKIEAGGWITTYTDQTARWAS
jgi:hypothetical protein